MDIEQQYLQEAKGFFASQQFSSAGLYARKVLRRNSQQPEALTLLGLLALKQKDIQEANKLLSKAVTLAPDNKQALQGLAQLAETKEDFFEAFKHYQTLAKLYPNDLTISFKLGIAASTNGNMNIAESALSQCVNNSYADPAALLNLAHVYKAKGDTEKSSELYHQFIKQAPEHQATGYWSLADLKSYTFNEQDAANISVYLMAKNISPARKALMLFAQGRMWEQNKQFDKAYASMKQANALLSPLRPFKQQSFMQIINSLSLCHPSDVLAVSDHVTPIFIVGMPRSGTTLVEQILASHSNVEATDELPFIERIALQLEMSGGYASNLASMSIETAQQLRARYLAEVKPYFKRTPAYFIDKNPNNFLHIGLIKTLFPNAKIVNVIRHTTDNAISVFKQHFSRGHDYSYSMDGIVNYWNAYHEIMLHWNKLYGEQINHISFEQLVREPDTQIKAILDYCELTFEQECIDFHQSTRAVLTPSAAQVRRPMNIKAIGMNEKYKSVMGIDYQRLEDIAAKVRQSFLS